MPLTAEQLKKAEQRLAARERDWLAKEKEIERLVKTGNITLDALLPQVTAARQSLKEVQDDILLATQDKQTLLAQNDLLEQGIKDATRIYDRGQSHLAELNQVIAAKEVQIDGEMADYAQAKRAEADTALAGKQAELTAATNSLDALTVQVKAKRDELSDVAEATLRAADEHGAALERQAQELDGLTDKLPLARAALDDVTKQLGEARLELEFVVAERNKAKVEHENYILYEQKARKALAVKDGELQERSAELDQSSRHLQAQRSFLPPL